MSSSLRLLDVALVGALQLFLDEPLHRTCGLAFLVSVAIRKANVGFADTLPGLRETPVLLSLRRRSSEALLRATRVLRMASRAARRSSVCPGLRQRL